MEAEALRKKAIRGGLWVFALRTAQQVLTFVRLIILARILAPTDFGLMGIAAVTMAALDVFSETGFQAALVQKKGDIRRYLDTVWTVSVARGLTLFAIIYISAPYVAAFFMAPKAEAIIRVISLSPLLSAFTNIGIVYFQKDLEFDRQFRYQLAGTTSDFAVSIGLALMTHSVWALVFGLLAGNIARLIASYVLHPYRPKLNLDMKAASELFGFGKWVLGSGVLIFLITQGDNIVVGRLLGVAALGLYQMAYLISNAPATEITQVISQVTFPAYSKIQDNLVRLRQAYLEVLKTTALAAFPLASFWGRTGSQLNYGSTPAGHRQATHHSICLRDSAGIDGSPNRAIDPTVRVDRHIIGCHDT
jgi:O-antigen/teichoic acid export membrane protein